jgi:3-oxoacyl-[acyl-carrier-protein] synthase-3
MLQALQRQFGLDDARMPIDVHDIGNLSTASLPVHIARWLESPRERAVKHSLAVGFGVGYSWGATHITWH